MPLFFSCSSSDDSGNGNEDPKEVVSIVGVWENGDFFVSFDNEGFYSAYLDDIFIDSGDYSISGSSIYCQNAYFNRTTSYIIKNVSETSIELSASYIDVLGDSNNKDITFLKSSKVPASKNNSLSGKSYSWYASSFGTIKMSFNSLNSGVKSAEKGSAANYPLQFYYIFIDGCLYHQILKENSVQVPSIGSWTNYNTVKGWKLSFAPNGGINGHELIE